MAITLTPEEKAELERENTLIRDLPGASGASQGDYHNPVTGKEISGPVDPYHMTRRLRQGWRLGSASPELREKWLAEEAGRKEKDDAMVREYEESDQHRTDLDAQAKTFNDAVATAVTQVLEKLGHKDETVVESKSPEQMDFFKAVDAPTESDTKLNVSPASRPELKLVE